MTQIEVLQAIRALPRKRIGTTRVEFFSTSNGTCKVAANIPLTGTVTPLVAHIFSSGQCHALAVALHEILGWPIVGCWSRYAEDRTAHHIAVQHPRGFTADIHGIRCIDWNHRKMSAKSILARRNTAFLPPAMDLARYFAPEIAEAIRKDEDRSVPWPWER